MICHICQESTALPVVDVNGGLVGQWNDDNPMKLVRSLLWDDKIQTVFKAKDMCADTVTSFAAAGTSFFCCCGNHA